MKCAITSVDDVTLVEIAGDIDGNTAGEIQEQILPEIEDRSNILLDMSKVDYMSSAGLRILLVMYRQVKKLHGQIVLAGLSEEIRDVMTVTGFLSHFRICATVEEGLAAFQNYSEPM